MGVAVASSGSPEKIAHNLGSSGLAHLFPDPRLVRADRGQGRAGGRSVCCGVCGGGSPRRAPGTAHHAAPPIAAACPTPRMQVVSAKYVQRGKPAPDVYLETLRRLGCADAPRALVVEDAGTRACMGAV